jgi:signal transduction histidine kinase/DNA-binding response OmpR family regulator/ligand-binding sensor domain-containing protein
VGNRIRALHEDANGTLWIGTENGLSVRRHGRFRRVEGPSHVASIDEARDGTVWLGSRLGLYRTTGGSPADTSRVQVERVSMPAPFKNPYVWHVDARTADSAWVALNDQLFLYDEGSLQRNTNLPRSTAAIRLVDSGPKGRLWISTTSQLLSVKNGAVTRYPRVRGVAWTIEFGPDGTPWLTTTKGGLYRITKGKAHPVATSEALGDDLRGLERDESGQWWIGSFRGGLTRLRSRLFHTLGPAIRGSVTHGLYADDTGSVWAAFPDRIYRISASGTLHQVPWSGLSDHTVFSVVPDDGGTLWIGTTGELLRRRNGSFEPVQYGNDQSIVDAQMLYRDRTGALWMASGGDGVFRYRDGTLDRVLASERYDASILLALHRDRAGALWIGTKNKGVGRYANDTLTWYGPDDGLPYVAVRDVHETSDGTIWVSTYGGGIARFEETDGGGRFVPVTPADGLPAGTIHVIHEAPDGIFWMTSNEGVFRVPRAQVEAVADGRRDRLYAQAFDETDGMPVRECNGNFQPALTEDPSGRLWIPTMAGPTVVDPQDPSLAVPDSIPLHISGVRVDGTPRPADSLELAPSSYRLALDFAATSLRHAEDLYFRYRLDGGSWIPAGGRHTAEFTNLDAGTHRFAVQATLNGETWYTLEAPLRFTVAPHFYETGWFRLLVVGGLLGLIGGAYLWRTRVLRRRRAELSRLVDERTEQLAEEKRKTEQQARRLETLDEQKNRFFANVSHELRTPLTILKGTTQDLLDGAFGELPAPARRQLEIMRGNVDRLRRLTDQLLDLSRLETTDPELDAEPNDLVALLRHTVRSFTPLAERRGLDLELVPAVEAHPCRVDPEKWEKIVGNLLSNALQNTPEGGTVRVELDVGEDDPPVTVLRVADTGRGIAPERQDEIFERFAHSGREDDDRNGTGIGLSLVREYVDLHDGTITLDSTPGEGSTFTVRLPLPPAAPDAVRPERPSGQRQAPSMTPDDAPTPASGDGAPGGDDHPVLLIVEDNADVRAYLRRHLSGVYQIAEAPSGAEGLDRAREIEPDLVLTDLMMPEMDGVELCRKIRADAALARTPVLLLTARAAEEDAVAGLEAGADAYVTKPFSMAELKARLRRLLEAHRPASDGAPDGLLTPTVEATPADEAFLDRVTDAIDANLSRPGFTVEDLAAEVGLSPRQLQRKLKRLTDTSPAAFVRRYRLDVAAQLLEKEAGTVSEVAYEVGFGTLETFSARFEERFGCPPSAYPEDASKTAA